MARILDFADGFQSSTEPTSVPFPADQVEVTPAGNLSSTDLQSALQELQGDIDATNDKIGSANGIASLDSSGKVPASQIPAVAIIDVYSVAHIAARDALTVQEGDVAVVADAGSGVSKSYIYDGSSWIELLADGSLAAHQASSSAHAASTITNTPSGNLAATNVQAALNELQTELDGKLTDGFNIIGNSKLATVATQTIKGRTTALAGNVEDLTPTQVTAMLNTMVGDSGSGGTKGLVPAPAAGDATKFFTGAGTYVSGLTNPMTTAGDTIYGGASGIPTRLANGTAGQVYTSSGGTSAPTWTTIVTPWVSWTPTGSWTTNVTYTGKWRRVGDTLFAQVLVMCSGAPNATTLTISLSALSLTIDTAKLLSTTNFFVKVGDGTALDAGAALFPLSVQYTSTTSVAIFAPNSAGSYASLVGVDQIVPLIFANTDGVQVNFSVPIVGW